MWQESLGSALVLGWELLWDPDLELGCDLGMGSEWGQMWGSRLALPKGWQMGRVWALLFHLRQVLPSGPGCQ